MNGCCVMLPSVLCHHELENLSSYVSRHPTFPPPLSLPLKYGLTVHRGDTRTCKFERPNSTSVNTRTAPLSHVRTRESACVRALNVKVSAARLVSSYSTVCKNNTDLLYMLYDRCGTGRRTRTLYREREQSTALPTRQEARRHVMLCS